MTVAVMWAIGIVCKIVGGLERGRQWFLRPHGSWFRLETIINNRVNPSDFASLWRTAIPNPRRVLRCLCRLRESAKTQ